MYLVHITFDYISTKYSFNHFWDNLRLESVLLFAFTCLLCYRVSSTSTFKKLDKEQIFIAVKWLDSKKVSKFSDMLLRIIKEFSDIFGGFLAKNFNECLDKCFFPDELKCAEVATVYKKG